MTAIATADLKNISEIYEKIKVDYPEYSERFVYFLFILLFVYSICQSLIIVLKTFLRQLNCYATLSY